MFSEVSAFEGPTDFKDADERDCVVTAPLRTFNNGLHIVLKVTDSGAPALTSYRRIIIKVE